MSAAAPARSADRHSRYTGGPPAGLLDVSGRLGRLAAAFPDARLVEVEGGHTFLPLDEPGRVASEISTFLVPA